MTAVLEKTTGLEAYTGAAVQQKVVATATNLYDVSRVTPVAGRRDLPDMMTLPEFYSPGAVRQTSLVERPSAWEHLQVFDKLETEQSVQAFKPRGAFLACMLAVRQNPSVRHFVTASAGNHGLGVALFAEWYNNQLKMTGQVRMDVTGEVAPEDRSKLVVADVFCASTADPDKRRMLRSRNAQVHDTAVSLETAKLAAREHQERLGDTATYVDPFDDPAVMAGQSSIMLETVLQLHDQGVDLRNKPLQLRVGGGGFGLANGCAVLMEQLVDRGLLHPESEVIATQMEYCDATSRALGRLAHGLSLDNLFVEHGVDRFDPAADGTAVRTPGAQSLPLSAYLKQKGYLRTQTVSKGAVAAAMHRAEQAGHVVEPAGALPDAGFNEEVAYWSKHWVGNPSLLLRPDGSIKEMVVVKVVSGGNRSEATRQAFAAEWPQNTDADAHAVLSGHFPRTVAAPAPERSRVPVDQAEQRRFHLGALVSAGIYLLR